MKSHSEFQRLIPIIIPILAIVIVNAKQVQ